MIRVLNFCEPQTVTSFKQYSYKTLIQKGRSNKRGGGEEKNDMLVKIGILFYIPCEGYWGEETAEDHSDQLERYLDMLPSLTAVIFSYSAMVLTFKISSLTLGISLGFQLLTIRDLAANRICIAIDFTWIGYSDIFTHKIAFSIVGFVMTPVTQSV